MDEFERYPNLMSAVLGIPPWAKHLRTLNNLNTLAAIILAIVVGFSQSLGNGLTYAAIYLLGWLIVAGVGSTLAGKVVKITDGDTLYVLNANTKSV